MSQIDYSKSAAEMQELYLEKYSDLAARVEKKNKTASRFKEILTSKQYKYLEECGTFIGLSSDEVIIQANFCKNRICPVCNKRNSVKKWYYIKSIAEELNKEIEPKWLFLTLTVKNVTADELNSSITKLMKSINRLFSRKTWNKRVLGFFRSLEITYNKEKNTFHPHYHILIAVPSDYFTNKELYLETWQWRQMWEKSAELDYNAQVDIREVKAEENQELAGAIAEVAKYAVKTAEIAKTSSQALKCVLKAIKGRRLISYGGIIHERYKEIQAADEQYKTAVQAEKEQSKIKYYQFENGKYKSINC